MDLRPSLTSAMDAFSLPVTVTVPSGSPVTTTGFWLEPEMQGLPSGEFSRMNAKRIMVLSRVDVPTAPRGTTIVAPEKEGDANKTWRVDGVLTIEADHHRVSVVLEP